MQKIIKGLEDKINIPKTIQYNAKYFLALAL